MYDRRDGQAVYKLVFPDRPGLTVKVRQASLAGMIDLAEATPVLRRNVQRGGAQTEVENLHAWRRLARAFASALLEWDLFDGGRPVPATLAGVMSLELAEVMDFVSGWRQAMSGSVGDVDSVDDGLDGEVDPVAAGEAGDGDGAALEGELDEEWLAQLPVTVEPAPEAQPTLQAVSSAQ